MMEKVQLNKHNLDNEAEQLPSAYYEAATLEEQYTADVDVLKVQLDSMREKVELEIRSLKLDQVNEKYKLVLEKLTESTVNALVGQDPRVEDLRTRWNESKRLSGTYRAYRKALDKKYGMIEVLSFLHNSGWFRRGSIEVGGPQVRSAAERTARVPQSVRDRFVG